MKIYILDDDEGIIHTLRNIIEDYNLGTVAGYSLNPVKAFEEINIIKPDILLIDLLMDEMDGVEVISKLNHINSKVIMISQVVQRELIGEAYKCGIEFFINKPINSIEVVQVIKNTIDKISNEKTLNEIQNLFGKKIKNERNNVDEIHFVEYILNQMGIIYSNGGDDLIKLFKTYQKKEYKSLDIYKIIDIINDNPEAVKQRIRRAIKKALTNLAILGNEDYFDPNFTEYASMLFEFKEVKKEMDYLKGKSKSHGSINIEKFIYGLKLLNEKNINKK